MRKILHDLKPSYKYSRSNVEFSLPSSQHGLPHIYRTDDQIKGEILFKPCRDIVLRDLCITFEGIAKATIWEPNIERRTGSPCITQRFMRLHQPVEEPLVSEGMFLEPGKTYRFPFLFVVPSGLLPQACQHPCKRAEVRSQHLSLPPSLGHEYYPKERNRFSLSLEPDTASITYAIRFKATEISPKTNLPSCTVDRSHTIYILPTLPEMPPILIPGDSTTYKLSKETVFKELKGEKLGRLTVTANQPKAIQLGQTHSQPMQPKPTMLVIDLEFLPAEHNQSPPRPKKIQGKLNAMTHFGIEPYEDLPDRIQQRYFYPRHRSFCRKVSLPSRDVISVRWEKQCSSGQKESAGCKASISLPIVLPENVVYTPTFFSCLISRTYSLRVDVSFNVRHKAPFALTVSLTIPIQICSDIASEQR